MLNVMFSSESKHKKIYYSETYYMFLRMHQLENEERKMSDVN